MLRSVYLEDQLMAHGAQGHQVDDFLKKARIIYRKNKRKQSAATHVNCEWQWDVKIGHGKNTIAYRLLDIDVLLRGTTIVMSHDTTFDSFDAIQLVIRNTTLRDIDQLNIYPPRYDAKRKQYYIRVSAKPNSFVYKSGGRLYLRFSK